MEIELIDAKQLNKFDAIHKNKIGVKHDQTSVAEIGGIYKDIQELYKDKNLSDLSYAIPNAGRLNSNTS